MKIRPEQMKSLSQSHEEGFIARMVAYLRENFPKQLEAQRVKEKGLDPMVRQGMADARKYGFEYEDDIRCYLECMVFLGAKFDRDKKYPWAGETLRRDDLDTGQKLESLDEQMLFELEWEDEEDSE